MTIDPVDEFYHRRHADESDHVGPLAGWRERLIAGGLPIFERAATGNIFGLALGLVGVVVQERDRSEVTARLAELEDELRELQGSHPRARRLRGVPLELLALTVERECSAWYSSLAADDAIARLEITAVEYRGAALELEELDLCRADPNMCHASGIQRTRLTDTGYLRAARLLVPDVNVEGEVARVLRELAHARPSTSPYFQAAALLEATRIPVARFDLIMRGLTAFGIVHGTGTGHPEWGSRMLYELTPHGRRVIRGDESLEALLL